MVDPLTGQLHLLWRFRKCPGRAPGCLIGPRLWKGHFEVEWLFCWLWWAVNVFEKT